MERLLAKAFRKASLRETPVTIDRDHLEVSADGSVGQEESLADLLVGQAGCREFGNLAFLWRHRL